MPLKPGALITDFDGTITERDFYLLVAERFMNSDAMRIWDDYRDGRMTHFEAMQAFFSYAPTDEAMLAELLQDTKPDPKLREATDKLRSRGWDLVVVSAGSSWYIDRILQRAGVQATIHSNPGRIVSGKGLVMNLPKNGPFFSADVGIDKSAVVSDALRRYKTVAFAGDGPPDVAPALLVSLEHRFARGFLAEELQRRGELFSRFASWSEIVDSLFSAVPRS